MNPERRNRGLLARGEAAALECLLVRLPSGVTPDMLSVLSLLGAACAGLGYALALQGWGWLLLAFIGFFLNWLGDSLDGKLARRRGPDRGMGGFMLDNGLDMISSLMIAVGFACSGLVQPLIPFVLLSLYVMLANLALARMAATGVHDLSVGPIGTTELRVCFALLALVLIAIPHEPVISPLLLDVLLFDVLSFVWALAMVVCFVGSLKVDVLAHRTSRGRAGKPGALEKDGSNAAQP